jgi:glycosyltransferase involved in cell wall biosynthesis
LDLDKQYLIFPVDPKRIVKIYPIFKKVLELTRMNFNVDEIILSDLYRKAVKYALNTANVVVFTSHSEALNIVIKESLTCNIPVVSVNVGDAMKILKNLNGCYVKHKSPNELYKAVIKIFNTCNEFHSFRDQIKHLLQKIIAKRIINLYQKILE